MLFTETPYKFEFVYNFYLKFVAEIIIYVRNFVLYISIWLIGYFCVCCVVYRRYARRLPSRTRGALGAKRVLLVIVHPDDECMFFGPTIFRLCEQGAEVYLLCLSNGNYEGKGSERRKELWYACHELGVPDSNICLITDTRLPDDPKTQWPVPVVAKLIQQQLEALEIDTLVTFDRGGISSHPNHSAVFYAVAYMFVEKNMPPKCTVYTLDSVNILRKYVGFLDLPLSFVLSSKSFGSSCNVAPVEFFNNASMLLQEDCAHVARWIEERQCYVVILMSTYGNSIFDDTTKLWQGRYIHLKLYMFINTLRKISLADIELELEVDD